MIYADVSIKKAHEVISAFKDFRIKMQSGKYEKITCSSLFGNALSANGPLGALRKEIKEKQQKERKSQIWGLKGIYWIAAPTYNSWFGSDYDGQQQTQQRAQDYSIWGSVSQIMQQTWVCTQVISLGEDRHARHRMPGEDDGFIGCRRFLTTEDGNS